MHVRRDVAERFLQEGGTIRITALLCGMWMTNR